jgi:hypothetical protein
LKKGELIALGACAFVELEKNDLELKITKMEGIAF